MIFHHFDPWEIHVFTFLSFEVVVFIVIPTAFQKTNNFYVLGSFSYWFSILISFLDTKKKIIPVQLQKLASYLDYKMIIEFDCAVMTESSVGLIKSMLLKYHSNKIYPHHLPTHTNTFEQPFSNDTTYMGISFVFTNHLNQNIICW